MMSQDADELARLRDALHAAQRQMVQDRAEIASLRGEMADRQREGQHWVRNILSIVRSIARRTVEEGETAETYRARLDSRLASFANLQGQLARAPRCGIDLYALIDGELLAFGIKPGGQAHAAGPPVRIGARPASVLGLAFHELVRMAIEGGASAGLDGRIDVDWRLPPAEGEPRHLEIVWVETGRQPFAGPASDPAFGREVVEQAVAYEVGGEAQLDITPDGLTGRFVIPLDRLD